MRRVTHEINTQLYHQVEWHLCNQPYGRVQGQIKSQLRNPIDMQVWGQVRFQILIQLRNETSKPK